MGYMVDGEWRDQREDDQSRSGRFERPESTFRDRVGGGGNARFAAEAGRYHLYIALACPWAHRTLIVRKLKGLEEVIGLSVVAPEVGPRGWSFGAGPGTIPDTVNGFDHLDQLYSRAAPDFTGRTTVPVLWDKAEGTIVNNESSEIIRMLNSEFEAWGEASLDLYPEALRPQIDAVNDLVYGNVNNGVYKCGFATSQEAYEAAFDALFATLDELEARLGRSRYLVGESITEADWRLFATLVRFDLAYYGNFKCNKRPLAEYENLWGYTRELYQQPGIAETVDQDHIKRTYYSIARVNPTGIVPKGPEIDFTAPHGRGS